MNIAHTPKHPSPATFPVQPAKPDFPGSGQRAQTSAPAPGIAEGILKPEPSVVAILGYN